MDQQPAGKNRQVIAALAVLIVIVAIVGAASLSAKNNNNTSVAADTSNSTSASTSTTTSGIYKDGTYKATGSYDSPGGTEGITISVTLKGNVVTDTSAISGSTGSESRGYQEQFIKDYKQSVVGKMISTVKLNRVSGSSLTSQGFNSAIEQIKKQAQA